jgi:hypothetical protein
VPVKYPPAPPPPPATPPTPEEPEPPPAPHILARIVVIPVGTAKVPSDVNAVFEEKGSRKV